jgi:hypothetical protein
MPKLIATDELDALLRAIAGFPNGASVEEIRSAPAIELPKRTLQRRLAQLLSGKSVWSLPVVGVLLHDRDPELQRRTTGDGA